MIEDVTEKIRLNVGKVQLLDLPTETIAFLCQVGLKTPKHLCLSFDGGFPTLNEYCVGKGLAQIPDGDNFYRIGTDEGSELCILKGDGSIIAINPSHIHQRRFVNSSFLLFQRFIDEYAKYADDVSSLSEDEAAELVKNVRARMEEWDAPAFSDPENWWAVITEQMANGQL
jgi:hypothetical protein